MNRTKIDWCDYTWNPVTGCYHGCEYCYARRIANRFKYTYPNGFEPTFHPDRLNEPAKVKKPSRIFVVSMGDLFGDWVPDEWLNKVADACARAPQHTYLFLTKNYEGLKRAHQVRGVSMLFGVTVTCDDDIKRLVRKNLHHYIDFVSIEPLLSEIKHLECILRREFQPGATWVIVGAQTGPGAKPPRNEWVKTIIDTAREYDIPVFIKENVRWPKLIREFPEDKSL